MYFRGLQANDKVRVGTIALIGLCVGVHVSFFCLSNSFSNADIHLNDYSLAAYPVFQLHQVWRLITSSFIHGDIWHLLANMSALYSFQRLEKEIGTSVFLTLAFVLSISINLLYCLFCYAAYYSFVMVDYPHTLVTPWLHYHSVGFSGTLFSFMVIKGAIDVNETHTNRIELPFVPTNTASMRLYHRLSPWLLMLVIQLIFPRASWLGHLSGIICGHLCTYGAFDMFLPSTSCFLHMERQGEGSYEGRCKCIHLPSICVENERYAPCRERSFLIEPSTPSLNGEGHWTGRTGMVNDWNILQQCFCILCSPFRYYRNTCCRPSGSTHSPPNSPSAV